MRLDQQTIHKRIAELLGLRKNFVVASIVEVKGSCPQQPGARMIVLPGGAFEFTIGGGTFEAEVIADAISLLSAPAPESREYKLTKSDLGMYCGGLVRVWFEPYRPTAQLLIFGGGHVGQALSRIAAASELFRVVVIDDRKEYAQRKKHAAADACILTDRTFTKGVPEADAQTFIVIVTRCHATDQILVKRYLDLPHAYLGLIGSEAKARQFARELMQQGVTPAQLERLHSPIGLPIGGKDPAEVAVSILAEVIQIKNRLKSEAPRHLAVQRNSKILK
jgi:xanthine dehydrogenase accessory factor